MSGDNFIMPNPEFNRPQVLLVTKAFPPSTTGSALILNDVLRFFPANSLMAVCGPEVNPLDELKLPFKRRLVKFAWNNLWTDRLTRRLPEVYVSKIYCHASYLARKYKVKRIYAHFPDGPFVAAAYLTAKRLGLPLTIYLDILWEEGSNFPRLQQLAKKYEGRVVRYADQRFAITESAVEYLSTKHSVPFEWMPHTVDKAILPLQLQNIPERPTRRIHFAGGIYHKMNLDSILRLARVLSSIKEDIVLELYSPITADNLRKVGLPSQSIRIGFAPRHEVQHFQRQSDILFLPQAFHSSNPIMIEHNFPTKTLEYMTAGRPILVHSPANSYLAKVANEWGFGLVVDTADEDRLREAVEMLLDDKSLQKSLVQNAVHFAHTRDSKHWAAFLYQKLFCG